MTLIVDGMHNVLTRGFNIRQDLAPTEAVIEDPAATEAVIRYLTDIHVEASLEARTEAPMEDLIVLLIQALMEAFIETFTGASQHKPKRIRRTATTRPLISKKSFLAPWFPKLSKKDIDKSNRENGSE